MSTRFHCILLSAFTLILVGIGCGGPGANRSVSVNGKVTYKGQPVTGGDMTLFVGEAAYPAAIGPDGTYSANQVPEGEAIATINTDALNPNKPKYGGKKGGGMSPLPEGAQTGPKGTYVKIPAKYKKKETSDLKVSLKRGKQEANFELKD